MNPARAELPTRYAQPPPARPAAGPLLAAALARPATADPPRPAQARRRPRRPPGRQLRRLPPAVPRPPGRRRRHPAGNLERRRRGVRPVRLRGGPAVARTRLVRHPGAAVRAGPDVRRRGLPEVAVV